MRFLILIISFFSFFTFSQTEDSVILIDMQLYIISDDSNENIEVFVILGDSLVYKDTFNIAYSDSSILVKEYRLEPNSIYTIICNQSSTLESRDLLSTKGITKHTRFIREIRLLGDCKPSKPFLLIFKKNETDLTLEHKNELQHLCYALKANPNIVIKLLFFFNSKTENDIVSKRNTEVLAYLLPCIKYNERIVLKNIDFIESNKFQEETIQCEIISFDFEGVKD